MACRGFTDQAPTTDQRSSPNGEILKEFAGPELRVDQARRGDGVGMGLPVRISGQRDEVLHIRLLGQLECGLERLGQWGQIHALDALQRGRQRVRIAEIAGDGRHPSGSFAFAGFFVSARMSLAPRSIR